MTEVKQVTVRDSDGEVRLDRWFKRHYPQVPFGTINKALRKGQIRVDSKRAKGDTRVHPGQVIRIPPFDRGEKPSQQGVNSDRGPSDHEIADIKKQVLYQDDAIIVFNKPAGLSVQGGSGTKKHLDRLLVAFADEEGNKPKLVHRLDKDTSGVLVVARTPSAASHLTQAFRQKEAQKTYWALVLGVPEIQEGEINLPLGKGPSLKGEVVQVDRENGKRAISRFRVLESVGKQGAWLALSPITGRTHQLRVHCQAIGCPIIGDGKYGGAEARPDWTGVGRQLHLHARRLHIEHPNGQMMTFVAPLSKHMANSFDALGLDQNNAENDDFSDWD